MDFKGRFKNPASDQAEYITLKALVEEYVIYSLEQCFIKS